MELEKILKKIREQKQVLEHQLNEKDEVLNFFDNYFQNNSTLSFEGLMNINTSDFTICYLLANNENLEFKELKEQVYSFRKLLENSSVEDIQKIILASKEKKDSGKIDDVIEKIANNKVTVFSIKFEHDQDIKMSLVQLLRKYLKEDRSIYNYLTLYKNNSELLENAIAITGSIKGLKQQTEELKTRVEETLEKNSVRAGQNRKDRFAKKMIMQEYNLDILKKEFDSIRNYYDKCISNDKTKKRAATKVLSNSEFLLKELPKSFKKEEIKNCEVLTDKIEDANLKKELLLMIYKHNLIKYKKTLTEYDRLSKNALAVYKKLFAKYNVKIDDTNIEILMAHDYDYLTKMLDIMKNLKLLENNRTVDILKNTDLITLEYINKITINGTISRNFIMVNIEVLSKNANESNNLIENTNYLEKNQINSHIFAKNMNTLLIDNSLFIKNINILKNYDLLKSLKNTLDMNFLNKENLESSLDKLLELGLEKQLNQNLNLLNYDEDKYKRLYVLKELNDDYKENTESVLSISRFIILDSEIDKYIYNAVKKNNNSAVKNSEDIIEDLELLKKYDDINSRAYNINGVLISKNKVRRLLDKKILIDAITDNSILTDDELNSLNSEFVNKFTYIKH